MLIFQTTSCKTQSHAQLCCVKSMALRCVELPSGAAPVVAHAVMSRGVTVPIPSDQPVITKHRDQSAPTDQHPQSSQTVDAAQQRLRQAQPIPIPPPGETHYTHAEPVVVPQGPHAVMPEIVYAAHVMDPGTQQQITIPSNVNSKCALCVLCKSKLVALGAWVSLTLMCPDRGIHPGPPVAVEGIQVVAPGFALPNGIVSAVDEAYQANNVAQVRVPPKSTAAAGGQVHAARLLPMVHLTALSAASP